MKTRNHAFIAGLLLFVSTAQAETLWRQFGFNAAHTSYNNRETILNRANVSDLTLLWKSDMPASGEYITDPVLGFDALFFGGTRIGAIDKSTGSLRWSRLSCSGTFAARPAFGRGIVLVGDAGGNLAGFDPATGNLIWCNGEGGSITSAPAIAGDAAFVTNGDAVIAVDQSSGAPRWRFAALEILRVHLTNTPAVANGVVFATGDGCVVALDGITGRQIWHRQFQSPTLSNATAAAVAQGVVYVGGYDGVFALNAVDGQLIWNNNLPVDATTPVIAEGRVFVNAEDPDYGLLAFDAKTGAFLWIKGQPGEAGFATAAAANGVVYDVAASDAGPTNHGRLMMFHPVTGRLIKRIRDPDGEDFGGQPIVANGVVYVATLNQIEAWALP